MADKLIAEWFWTDRWIGSSAFGLPIAVRGLYREMLTQAWRRGARLPNDHDQIRRFTGVTKTEWRMLWPRVEPFWRVDGDSLVNDTQLQIYTEAQRRAGVNTERATMAAQARWKDKPSTAQASAEHGAGSAQVMPSVSVSVSKARTYVARARETERADDNEQRQRFTQFRRAHPSATGWRGAWALWSKVCPSPLLTDQIVAAATSYAASRQVQDAIRNGQQQYIKQADNWLREYLDGETLVVAPLLERPRGCRHEAPCVDAVVCTSRQTAERHEVGIA